MNAIKNVAQRWVLALISDATTERAPAGSRRTPRGFQPAADGLPKRIAPAVFVPPPSDYITH